MHFANIVYKHHKRGQFDKDACQIYAEKASGVKLSMNVISSLLLKS